MSDEPTIRERVRVAFAVLRNDGFFARMDFQCCQTCAWALVPKGTENVVFFHQQDNEAFDRKGNLDSTLHIAWSGDKRKIAATLRSVGLNITVPRDTSTRFEVKGAI